MHWLDTLSLKALKRTPVFQNGWGEVAPFAPLGELANTVRPASRVELTWGAPFTVRGLRVQDGVAPSPSTEVLPAALHTLHVRRILTPRAPKARVVVPPSWGDGGFGPRMWLVGALVARGLEPWLLEGAYFGARAAPLTRVEDFLRMGLSHLDEVRALLQTHHDEGVPTSLAGYSMAGQLGGHAVATLPFEVPVVVMAAPPSADVVFIDGPLSTQLRWPALGDGAQEKLRDVMTRLDLLKVPAPVSKKRAVVVTAVDGIVSPQASARIAGHWGVMPHTVRSGHLGAYVFHRRALQQLITETVLPR